MAILQVRESFAPTVDGGIVSFRKGELVDSDHPVVKRYPQYFSEPVIDHPAPRTAPVEQATAAPGQKRGR
jgi:hypothetical protein